MISLRKITAGDAPLLVQWRNADARFFGDGSLLTMESHLRWFETVYLHDPRDHMYVVVCDDRPVGTIGVKLGAETEIVRVLLGEKDLARTGVMSGALELISGVYRDLWLSVKRGNDPAIRLYRKHGFAPFREDDDLLFMSRWS